MNDIAVLTFHSVFNHDIARPWSFLSEPIIAFENTLKYLKKHKYETITLKELYELKKDNIKDNKKRVVLNFDDGFLDNFTIVYPLLMKYGMKATVFVSPEFVDKRDIVRPLFDIDSKKAKKTPIYDLQNHWGYMSWKELKIINDSGIFDVQCHANSHTWYYVSNVLKDIHYENDNYYWLWWNKNIGKKPQWLTEYNEKEIPYGFPVFEYAKSLSGKRFFPYNEVIAYIESSYLSKKPTFNDKKAFISFLSKELDSKFGGDIGYYETDDEFEKRIKYELLDSKKTIEKELNKTIDFLAWPGGAVSELAINVAKEAGFLAFTSKEKHVNNTNDNPSLIYRMGGWSGKKKNNKSSNVFEKLFIMMQLSRKAENKGLANRIINIFGNRHRKKHIKECSNRGEKWE